MFTSYVVTWSQDSWKIIIIIDVINIIIFIMYHYLYIIIFIIFISYYHYHYHGIVNYLLSFFTNIIIVIIVKLFST